MDKAFAHKEKCGCEYCNSERKMQFALVKIKDKFNFISVYEVDALNSDKLIYRTEDIDKVLNAEKENKFSVFYGGIIYYIQKIILIIQWKKKGLKNTIVN